MRRIWVFFAILSVFISLAIVEISDAFTGDLVDACIIAFIAALIAGVIIEIVWTRFSEIPFLASMLVFALQCLVLYLVADYTDVSVWVMVATQVGMFLVLGPVLFIFIDGDFDLGF